jgi:hypothetical protein
MTIICCNASRYQISQFYTVLFRNKSEKKTLPTKAAFNAEIIPIKVITKLPNSEQSYKGKVKTHNYINRQNQSTTGKL